MSGIIGGAGSKSGVIGVKSDLMQKLVSFSVTGNGSDKYYVNDVFSDHSEYTTFLIVVEKYKNNTDDTHWQMHLLTGTNTSYESSYTRVYEGRASNGTIVGDGGASSLIVIGNGLGTATGEQGAANIWVTGLETYPYLWGNASFEDSGGLHTTTTFAANNSADTTYTGFNFRTPTGNVDTVIGTVFGVV